MRVRLREIVQDGAARGQVATWDGTKWTATSINGTDLGSAIQTIYLFQHDRFPTSGTLSGTIPSTFTLSQTPVSGSLHVYLNGLEQDEGTDYTLSGAVVTTLTPMQLAAGDVLDARYAYNGTPTSTATTYTPIALADNFTRANTTSNLGSTSTGAVPWVQRVSVWGIQSNTAAITTLQTNTITVSGTPTAVNAGIATVPCNSADGTVSVTLGTVASAPNTPGLIFRYIDLQNYWVATPFALGKVVAGVLTGGIRTNPIGSAPVGTVVSVELAGSSVVWKVNGTAVVGGPVTDTDLVTATDHGIYGQALADALSAWSYTP